MKKHAGSLVILIIFMFMISGALQSLYAMGRNPEKGNSDVNLLDDKGDNPGNTGSPVVHGVLDSASNLTCLGLGVAGIGGYLLMRKRKDKDASQLS